MYARIESDTVVEGPRNIPRSWRNISGMHHLPAEKLKMLGWYPVTDDIEPAFDPDTERLVLDSYTIRTDDVLKTMKVEALSAAEIKAIADEKQRITDIVSNLPSWAAVSTTIDNIANLEGAKAFLKKLARVVYWREKNTLE
jgi:hypothetical protein